MLAFSVLFLSIKDQRFQGYRGDSNGTPSSPGRACPSATKSLYSSTLFSSFVSASRNPVSGCQLPAGFGCHPSSVQLPG